MISKASFEFRSGGKSLGPRLWPLAVAHLSSLPSSSSFPYQETRVDAVGCLPKLRPWPPDPANSPSFAPPGPRNVHIGSAIHPQEDRPREGSGPLDQDISESQLPETSSRCEPQAPGRPILGIHA